MGLFRWFKNMHNKRTLEPNNNFIVNNRPLKPVKVNEDGEIVLLNPRGYFVNPGEGPVKIPYDDRSYNAQLSLVKDANGLNSHVVIQSLTNGDNALVTTVSNIYNTFVVGPNAYSRSNPGKLIRFKWGRVGNHFIVTIFDGVLNIWIAGHKNPYQCQSCVVISKNGWTIIKRDEPIRTLYQKADNWFYLSAGTNDKIIVKTSQNVPSSLGNIQASNINGSHFGFSGDHVEVCPNLGRDSGDNGNYIPQFIDKPTSPDYTDNSLNPDLIQGNSSQERINTKGE